MATFVPVHGARHGGWCWWCSAAPAQDRSESTGNLYEIRFSDVTS